MKFLYDLYGGPAQIKEVFIYGTTLTRGALLMRGTTSGTNFGGAIVATGAFTDVVGVLDEAMPAINSYPTTSGFGNYLVNNTVAAQSTGTWNLKKCIVNPMAVYRVQYSQTTTDTFTGTMTSSGTTITCASLEDLTGGWIYDITQGTLEAVVGGSGLTTLTAFSPAIVTTDYVLKIHAELSKIIDLNSASTLFGGTGQSQAAAGTGVVTVLANYIEALPLIPFQRLNPSIHSGLTGLASTNGGAGAQFYSDVVFPKHVALHQS